jgi:hypothetical protein
LRVYLEGAPINFENYYQFGVEVNGGDGLITLMSVIKQLNILRLFIYTVRAGELSLGKIENAFVAELKHNPREVIIDAD